MSWLYNILVISGHPGYYKVYVLLGHVNEELVQLKADTQESRKAAFAPGTRKNLITQWMSFLLFCLHFELEFLPAEEETIALYAQFLSRSFKTVSSIQNYLSGVKLLHLYAGVKLPNMKDFSIKLVLDGIRRRKPHCVKQALPITPSILLHLYQHITLCGNGVTVWALFLIAFFLFLRKSNLVPNTTKSFDPKKQLTRADFVLGDQVLLCKIRWSKTIQYGQRVLVLPLFALPGSPLCPVTAYKHMIAEFPTVEGHDPAFQVRNGKKVIPLTYFKFHYYLRKLLQEAGYRSELFSSHSFRRGGATFAFQSLVPDQLIKLQGDWQSDAYQRYLDFSLVDRSTVFLQMAAHLPSM